MPAALQPLQWQRGDKLMMSCAKCGHKRGQCVPGLHEPKCAQLRAAFEQSPGMSITAVWYGWESCNLFLVCCITGTLTGRGPLKSSHCFNREVYRQRPTLKQASHLTGGTLQPARMLMPAPGPQAYEAHPVAPAAASPAVLDAHEGWCPVQSPRQGPRCCRESLAWRPTSRALQWHLPYPGWVLPQHQLCEARGLSCQQLPASQHCLCSTC